MRIAICRLPEGVGITVQGADMGRTFRAGDRVDLEAIAVQAAGERPASTWREILGHHVADHFELEAPARTRRDAAAASPFHEE